MVLFFDYSYNQLVETGLRDTDEAQLWGYAVREGTIIPTKDQNFAPRRLREPERLTIIWLRIGNRSRAALVRWLTLLLSSIEALVATGESVIEVRWDSPLPHQDWVMIGR